MLITEMKPWAELEAILPERLFILLCRGCQEIYFPRPEAEALVAELRTDGRIAGILETDYICSPENLSLRLARRRPMIDEADGVLILSCGVGVQTAAELLEERRVYAGCDTLRLPGDQGVTPLEVDCGRCGACWLNLTGGICPITACSKSLLNGPCGGAKEGKCEADPGMDCGWERILRRLETAGRSDVMRDPARIRDYTAGQKGCVHENH